MHHNRNPCRQQLRPPPQILHTLPLHLKPEPPRHNPPHNPSRRHLTRPRVATRLKRKSKTIHHLPNFPTTLILIERKIRIDVLVGAIMEDEDLAEEGEHGDVLGEGADEDRAAAELAVFGVGLVAEAEEDEEGVVGAGYGEGLEEDEGGGGD